MIVPGEMQQTVKYQLRDFFIQLQAIFFRLRCGSVDGNGDVAESRLTWSTRRKRKYVGGFINTAKLPVQLAYLSIRNKSDRG